MSLKLKWIKSHNGEGAETWGSRAGSIREVEFIDGHKSYILQEPWSGKKRAESSLTEAQKYLERKFLAHGTEIVELFDLKVVGKETSLRSIIPCNHSTVVEE